MVTVEPTESPCGAVVTNVANGVTVPPQADAMPEVGCVNVNEEPDGVAGHGPRAVVEGDCRHR